MSSRPANLHDRYAALHAVVDDILTISPRFPITLRDAVRREPGVYALFHQGELVYLGSTYSLRTRLSEHARSLHHAAGIDVADVFYATAYGGKHDSKAAEGALIEYYAPPWNFMGFGSKQRYGKLSQWETKYGEIRKSIFRP